MKQETKPFTFQDIREIAMCRADPELVARFEAFILHDLPHGTKIKLKPRNQDGEYKLIIERQSINSFDFVRFLDERTRSVTHFSGHLDRGLQKKGIAAQINSNLFELYRQLEMDSVLISAADVGTYAWARTGFIPHQWSWDEMRKSLRKRLDAIVEDKSHPKLPDGYVNFLRRVLSQDDPKHLWVIADQDFKSYKGQPLGKILILRSEPLGKNLPKRMQDIWKAHKVAWGGVYHFDDPDCHTRQTTINMMKKESKAQRKKSLAQRLGLRS